MANGQGGSSADPYALTGEDLALARNALAISAAQFAELVGVSGERTVFRWESAPKKALPGPVATIVLAVMTSRAVRRYFGLALPDD